MAQGTNYVTVRCSDCLEDIPARPLRLTAEVIRHGHVVGKGNVLTVRYSGERLIAHDCTARS